MPVELSAPTLERIRTLFSPEDGELAADLLTHECAENLPLYNDVSPEGLQRIRYACLKLSSGDLNQLEDAINLSKIDWRDTLVQAGFGYDPAIHLAWWPDSDADVA